MRSGRIVCAAGDHVEEGPLVSLTAVEWVLRHPLEGRPLAIIRLLYLGVPAERYYRAVTWHSDSSGRRLLGYWGSEAEAAASVLALYERQEGRPQAHLVQWKPPPATVQRHGRAASPAEHGRARERVPLHA